MRKHTRDDLINRLLEPEALHFVKRRLLDFRKLPGSGVVAGQAVSSAVVEYLGMHNAINPVYNDIDVFKPISRKFYEDNLYESGFFSRMEGRDLDTLEDHEIFSKFDRYGAITHTFNKNIRIIGSFNEGFLNKTYVETKYAEFLHTGPEAKVMEVIGIFDINATKVGFDVKESRRLTFTREFIDFLHNRELAITDFKTPLHSLIRLGKKMKELGGNVYSDIEEHKMLAMVYASTIRNSTRLNAEVKELIKNNSEFEPYILNLEKYFLTDELVSTPLSFGKKHRGELESHLLKTCSDLEAIETHDGKYSSFISRKQDALNGNFLESLYGFAPKDILERNSQDRFIEMGVLGVDRPDDIETNQENNPISYQDTLMNLPKIYRALKHMRKKHFPVLRKECDGWVENKPRTRKEMEFYRRSDESLTGQHFFSFGFNARALGAFSKGTLQELTEARKEMRFMYGKNRHYGLSKYFHQIYDFEQITKMMRNIKQVDAETEIFVGFLESDERILNLLDIDECRKAAAKYSKDISVPFFEKRIELETPEYKAEELVSIMELKKEGQEMDHCVGGYGDAVKARKSVIVKIAPKNKSVQRCTLELRPIQDGCIGFKKYLIGQIYGKGNSEIALDGRMYEILEEIDKTFKMLPLAKWEKGRFSGVDESLGIEFEDVGHFV